MCVNDLVVQGAQPLFFLDYFATGELEPGDGRRVVAGTGRRLRDAGCALMGGETAEMPGLYRRRRIRLAGFSVGAVERRRVLPKLVRSQRAGDVIIGLGSSGPHSNGLLLVRRVVLRSGMAWDVTMPALGAAARPWRGADGPDQDLCEVELPRGDAAGGVKALAHITGGGLIENPPRVLGDGQVLRLELGAWPVQPAFAWLAHAGRLDTLDLLRTFNCGIGMILVVDPPRVGTVRAALETAGETVHVVGSIVAAAGPPQVELVGQANGWPAGASQS